jgi:hypothetical protein
MFASICLLSVYPPAYIYYLSMSVSLCIYLLIYPLYIYLCIYPHYIYLYLHYTCTISTLYLYVCIYLSSLCISTCLYLLFTYCLSTHTFDLGKIPYLEGNKAIELANQVFGFNGWSSSIIDMTVDYVRDGTNNGTVSIGLSCIIRVTLKDGTFREVSLCWYFNFVCSFT